MGPANPLIMMLLMFGVFYFILIRPQAKRQREHQEMLKALDKGDMVVTRGGIIGKVTGTKDGELILEVQEKVRLRVLRTHVDGRYEPQKKAEEKAA